VSAEVQVKEGPQTRCFIADGHRATLEAVCGWVESSEDLRLVGTARDGTRALRGIVQVVPDVALLDIGMSGLTGIEVTRELRAAGLSTAIILYTGERDRARLLESLDAGAGGFIPNGAPPDEVIRALRIVAGGGLYVDAALAGTLTGPGDTERLTVLTKREREILGLLAEGMRNQQIARELSMSALTVRTHVTNAMRKLHADTRTQAVAQALRQSLIS
jgi:DNA-binding NarL/FixJ family response regulator